MLTESNQFVTFEITAEEYVKIITPKTPLPEVAIWKNKNRKGNVNMWKACSDFAICVSWNTTNGYHVGV